MRSMLYWSTVESESYTAEQISDGKEIPSGKRMRLGNEQAGGTGHPAALPVSLAMQARPVPLGAGRFLGGASHAETGDLWKRRHWKIYHDG